MLNSSIIAGPFLRADCADTHIHIKMLFTPLVASKARLIRLFLATRRKNNNTT